MLSHGQCNIIYTLRFDGRVGVGPCSFARPKFRMGEAVSGTAIIRSGPSPALVEFSRGELNAEVVCIGGRPIGMQNGEQETKKRKRATYDDICTPLDCDINALPLCNAAPACSS